MRFPLLDNHRASMVGRGGQPLRIRVLLGGGMRRILHDILKDTLATQPDMELAGDSHDLRELPLIHSTRNVDLVIVGAPKPDDFDFAGAILRTSPQVKVLVMATDGCNAVMYRLRPHQVLLGELSPQELLTAIRAEAQSQSTCRLTH